MEGNRPSPKSLPSPLERSSLSPLWSSPQTSPTRPKPSQSPHHPLPRRMTRPSRRRPTGWITARPKLQLLLCLAITICTQLITFPKRNATLRMTFTPRTRQIIKSFFLSFFALAKEMLPAKCTSIFMTNFLFLSESPYFTFYN